jgi:hypothetical protein
MVHTQGFQAAHQLFVDIDVCKKGHAINQVLTAVETGVRLDHHS